MPKQILFEFSGHWHCQSCPFYCSTTHSALQAIATKHICSEETHFQLKHSTKILADLLGKQK